MQPIKNIIYANSKLFFQSCLGVVFCIALLSSCPPASEASREVANLTERKNIHTPVHSQIDSQCVKLTLKKNCF